MKIKTTHVLLFFFFLITYQIVKDSDVCYYYKHREAAFTHFVLGLWVNTTSMEGNLLIPIKIKVYIAFNPIFVLLEIYTSNVFTYVQINVCLKLFISALFCCSESANIENNLNVHQ